MNLLRNNQSKRIIKIATFATVLLTLLFLLFPQQAHAEAVYQVLKTNDSIKNIWKNVKDLVNYLVVAVLIFVAFAQILHININTYGIKKILPALVLAVIGANLSYFICRVLVDVANVILTLPLAANPQTGKLSDGLKLINESGFMDLAKKDGKSSDFFVLFVKILMEFVGAVMIFVLAFLLFIRNWMIYFLVVLSPLAFMATAIPQGKSIFTQWWNQFLKWTFMPIVSIFWLWLGAQWSNTTITAIIGPTNDTDTSGWLMKSVFAMACFYLAITTPLKMGGPIMQQWGNLGKKAWGRTGGVVTKNFGTRASAEWMHQTTRATEAMGKIPIARKLVGGGERAEQALEDAKRGRAALASKFKGEYIKNQGIRRQRYLLDVESKEGSEKYEEALARGAMLEDKRSMNYARRKRFGRAGALAKMEEAEKGFAAFDSEMKKNFFKSQNASGQELVARDANGRALLAYQQSPEYMDRQKFIQRYGATLLAAEIGEREAKKASNDPMKKAAEDRIAAHNVAEEQKIVTELSAKLNEYRGLLGSGVNTSELRDQLLSSGRFSETDLELDRVGDTITDFADIVTKANQDVEARIKEFLTRHQVPDVSQLPPHLQDRFERAADGTLTPKPLETLEYTRLNQYLGAEIRDGASVVNDRFSVREIMNSLVHGNSAEGFDASDIRNYFAGNTSNTDPDKIRKIQEFIVASQKSLGNRVNVDTRAIVGGITAGLVNSAVIPKSTSIRGLEKIINHINEMTEGDDRTDLASLKTASLGNDEEYAKSMGKRINELFVKPKKPNTRNVVTSAIKSSPEAGYGGSQTRPLR